MRRRPQISHPCHRWKMWRLSHPAGGGEGGAPLKDPLPRDQDNGNRRLIRSAALFSVVQFPCNMQHSDSHIRH